jgi:hypothetical protein
MLDATVEKVRENRRVVSMAVVGAHHGRARGARHRGGPAEDLEFWLDFLRQAGEARIARRPVGDLGLAPSGSCASPDRHHLATLSGGLISNALSTVPQAA